MRLHYCFTEYIYLLTSHWGEVNWPGKTHLHYHRSDFYGYERQWIRAASIQILRKYTLMDTFVFYCKVSYKLNAQHQIHKESGPWVASTILWTQRNLSSWTLDTRAPGMLLISRGASLASSRNFWKSFSAITQHAFTNREKNNPDL